MTIKGSLYRSIPKIKRFLAAKNVQSTSVTKMEFISEI